MVTIGTITYKNQLTIPQEFIKKLGLKGIKKVLISSHDDEIVIKPLRSGVEELAGSLAHLAKDKPKSLKEIRKQTQKLVAAEIAKEGLEHE